jgi:hypothetical protein
MMSHSHHYNLGGKSTPILQEREWPVAVIFDHPVTHTGGLSCMIYSTGVIKLYRPDMQNNNVAHDGNDGFKTTFKQCHPLYISLLRF